MSSEADAFALVVAALTVVNLIVLGLVVKLYTEFAKDRFQSLRPAAAPAPVPGETPQP